MIKTLTTLFTFGLLLLTTNVLPQRVKANKITPGDTVSGEGIFYALPKTRLKIVFEVKQTKLFAPKDPKLCDRVLGNCKEILGSAPYVNNTKINISNPDITPVAIPDITNIYRVEAIKKWNRKKAIGFTLNDQGIIAGSTIENKDVTFDLVLSTIGTFTGLLRKTKSQSVTYIALSEEQKKDSTKRHDRILDLLEAKEKLFRSTTYAGDKATIEFKLGEIDKLLKTELDDLLGKKKTKSYTITLFYDIDTKADLGSNILLYAFEDSNAKKQGIRLDQGRFKDVLLPSSVMRKMDGNVATVTKLFTINLTEIPSLGSSFEVSEPSSDRGLAYRIPARAGVSLTYGQSTTPEPLYQGDLSISQLGKVAYLPYKIESAEIAYFEQTGAIQNLNVMAGPALTSEQLGLLDRTAQDVKGAIKGKSEVERLQERLDVLTLKKQLEDLMNNNTIEDE